LTAPASLSDTPPAPAAAPAPRGLAAWLARHGIHYGWLVVGVTFVAMLASAAVRSMPGVLIHPLEAEFGWDRATITLAVSINLLLFGLSGPIIGRLMDRRGPRMVAIGAVFLMAAGLVLTTTLMQTAWQLDLFWGLVIGAGAGGIAMVMVASVVNRWFDKRRGLVTGILGTGTSTGQIIFIPLVMWLSVTVGWRVGALFAAGLLLCLVLPLLVFVFRNSPRDVGLRRFGERAASAQKDGAAPPVEGEPLSMRQVVRSPDFWWLAGGFAVCGYTTNGLIGTHFIAHAAEHGVNDVQAAGIFGLMGGVNILGTIAAGMLADRISQRRILLSGLFLFRGLSLLALPFISDSPTHLTIFAILYGLNWFATAPVNQLLVADIFGRRSVATIYGWVFFGHQLGSALAAFTGGLVHNWLGDYQLTFITAGMAGLAAAGFSLQLREGQNRRLPSSPPAPPAPALSSAR
jgi:MFS family permease